MRALRIGLATVASLAIVSTGVLALWLVGSATGGREQFSSLEIAPRDAVFYVALNTDPTSAQWLAVNDALGTLNAKDPLRDVIDEELAKFDLELERDILPLAGDEGYLAITDIEDLSNNDGGLIVAFRLRDPGRAEGIFLDIAKQEGVDYAERAYEGETIYYSEGGFTGEDQGAMSVVGDAMVIGSIPQEVERVIDVIQGRAPNATTNERLQEMRAQQEEDFLVWGYGDVGQVLDTFRERLLEGLTSGGTETIEPFEVPVSPVPTATPSPPEPGFEVDLKVTSFDANYTVGEAGLVEVKETIAVDFGSVEKHGIYRDFPTLVPDDFANNKRVRVEKLEATRDGSFQPFEAGLAGDLHRFKIGDPNETVTGTHTYELTYSFSGGVHQYDTGTPEAYYELTWNATGDSWAVPIEKAEVTVNVPNGTIDFTDCYVGSGDFGFENFMPCEMTQEGAIARLVAAGPIQPGSGMHFDLLVTGESGAPPPTLVPAENRFGDEFPIEEDPVNAFPFDPVSAAQLFDQVRDYYDRLSFSVSARKDGFVLDFSIVQAEGADLPPAYGGTAFDSELAKRAPADAMAFFAGFDLYNGSYIPARDLMEELGMSQTNPLDSAVSDIEQEIGLDLEDDLLSLMTGEYALAFNASGFDLEQPEFDVLGMIDVNDTQKITDTMEKVGDYLESQDLGRTEDGSRDGVRLWSPADAPESIAWTVDGDTLAVGYPEASVNGFLDGHDESLSESADWKRTMDLLPEDKTSIFYLSLARVLEEVRKIEGTAEEFETSTEGRYSLADLTPVRTLGIASTAQDNGYGIRIVVLLED